MAEGRAAVRFSLRPTDECLRHSVIRLDSAFLIKYTDLVRLAISRCHRSNSNMAFFNSKLRYALCAAIDLAMQPQSEACQSREIATRQAIPGPYLDQILAALKGAGIVRSVRGAGGGYNLARPPERIRVGDVVRAMMRGDRLFAGRSESERPNPSSPGVGWIVCEFEEEIEQLLAERLDSLTLADLVRRKQTLDDSMSFMSGI
jgi:Rrf2 family protein